MKMYSLLWTLLLTTSVIASEGAKNATKSNVLSTLRPGHPRLIILDQDLERVKRLIDTDPEVRGLYDDIRKAADKMLNQQPVKHEIIGPRMLHQSRLCLHRVYILALMYRLTGNAIYAQRAEREMLTAAGFADWNPSHFLDTAEMTHALAVGYDWLYDYLSPASRAAIHRAILEKGLKSAEPFYRENKHWVQFRHNWNQVCNGGITIGALAIAEEIPELAAYIVERADQSIRRPTAELKPDGGWAEGPNYWGYAMSYTAYYIAALRSALGTDFGLHKCPGMAETGMFRIHSIGPTRLVFNYADANYKAAIGNTPQMHFFARLFDQPVYAWHQRRYRNGTHPMDLLWYDPRGDDALVEKLPLDIFFKNIDVVFLRSSWTDPNALYVGFKGGNNRVNHSHLDLGTFVFDAMGHRWAMDLGADEYNLPGYFGKERYTYYRLKTEGQNTLVINGQNQDRDAKAPIIAYGSKAERSFAVADLTAAYAKYAESVHRGIAMLDRKRVLIQDEIKADKSLDVEWNMHTTAQVEIRGDTAILTIDKQKLQVKALSPPQASWKVVPIDLKPPRRPTTNMRKLVLYLRTKAPQTKIRILLSPMTDKKSKDLNAIPNDVFRTELR